MVGLPSPENLFCCLVLTSMCVYLMCVSPPLLSPRNEDSFPIDEDGRYKNGQQMGYSVAMGPASGLGHVYSDPEDTQAGLPPPSYDDSRSHMSVTAGSIAPIRYDAPPPVSPPCPSCQGQAEPFNAPGRCVS